MTKSSQFAKALGVSTLVLLSLSVPQASAQSTDAGVPDVSYVTNSVDQGSTMVIMGDNFTPASQVWLLQSPKDSPDQLKKDFGQTAPSLPSTPPQGAVQATVVGTPESHMLAAGQVGYPNLSESDSVVPTVVWVRTSAGVSQPYLMNKPQLYFVSDAEAVPGERLRLFGRNFESQPENSASNYGNYLVAFYNVKTNAVYWGQILMDESQEQANVKNYVLNVQVPKDIAPGSYNVSVHGLYGGDQGWSNTLSLSIVASHSLVGQMARGSDIALTTPAQNSNENITVDTLNNLATDGITDDTDKIQNAIDKVANQGGGIVVLPAGSLAITKTLHVLQNVVLEGAGRGSTQLVVSPNHPLQGQFPITNLFASPSWVHGFVGDYYPYLKNRVSMVWLDNESGVQNMSIHVGQGADIGVLVGTQDPGQQVKDVFIKNTNITNHHPMMYNAQDGWAFYVGGVLVVSSTEGFTMTNDHVSAYEPLYMLSGHYPHTHANISNNIFEAYPHNSSNNVFANSIGNSIIEDNQFKNGMRSFSSQMGMWDNWIAGNDVSQDGGTYNASEMFMSEEGWGSPPVATGTVTSATYDSFTINTNLALKADEITSTGAQFYAFIEDGHGMGQYRKIVGNTGGTFQIDSPWTVVPDSTSLIQVIQGSVQNIINNNWISDSVGSLQFSYGAGLDNTVAGNNMNDAGSIVLFGGPDPTADPNHPYTVPAAYNEIVSNRLVNSDAIDVYGYSQAGVTSGNQAHTGNVYQYGQAPLYDTGGVFANTIRRNQVWSSSNANNGNQYYSEWLAGPDSGATGEGAINVHGGVFTIVEGNYIYNTENGLLVDGGKNNIIQDNRMDEVQNRLLDKNNPVGTVAEPPSWEPPY